MKTKEELGAIKDEVKALNKKLSELSEDELNEVIGGIEWLKEESYDIYPEYVISKEAVFKKGSRMSVRWITPKEDE
ncbi:MAG: bacteriocin [Clostridia bacterium]|nr:bacteriocin [Clostridia bacterium]